MFKEWSRGPRYAGGVPWPGIVTSVIVALAGVFVATETLASCRRWEPEIIGPPVFSLLGHGFYSPLAILAWIIPLFKSTHWAELHATLFTGMAILLFTLPVAQQFGRVANGIRLRRITTENIDSVHGSAHWATRKEIEAKHLLGNEDGIILGSWWDEEKRVMHMLRHTGDEHVLAFAPTGKGKGLSAVIPNLLTWTDAVVAHDMKGELWGLTSGYRARELGQKCFKWSPTETDSDCYNPLAEIRIGTPNEVRDAMNVAVIFVRGSHATHPNGDKDHWLDVAQALLTGMILHVLYAAKNEGRPTPTLAGVYWLLTPPGLTFREWLQIHINWVHDPDEKLGWTISPDDPRPTITHPVVRKAFQEVFDKAADDFDGTVSTLAAKMNIFQDPLVSNCTRRHDFAARDLLHTTTKLSVYVVVPFSDRVRLSPLLRLFYTQLVTRNSEKLANVNDPYLHQCLFVLDEFVAIGKMELFNDALTYIRGFGMKAFLISTSVGSIRDLYGKDTSLLANTNIKLAYTPDDYDSAEPISNATGKTTALRETASFSGQKNALSGQSNVTVGIAPERRNLAEPDEILRMRSIEKVPQPDGSVQLIPGDEILFMPGCAPILGTQFYYLQHPELVRRSQIPPVPRSVDQTQDVTNNSAVENAEVAGFRQMLEEALRS